MISQIFVNFSTKKPVPTALAGIFPTDNAFNPCHGADHFAFHQRGDDGWWCICRHHQHCWAAKFNAKIAPKSGKIGNRAFICKNGQWDRFVAHTGLQIMRSLAGFIQHNLSPYSSDSHSSIMINKPVICSNQAMPWDCLRQAGIADQFSGLWAFATPALIWFYYSVLESNPPKFLNRLGSPKILLNP